ncbi:hypothetical protein AAFF_G00153290 [Aldrovandia affinis]|uniref:Uncharacterized protein n=1 Tax=Aldrovandia affinis TaxID=143900 RepID=A0AAD7SZJ9_9TELE|nr:hypothetical protein AAFF_G00153290 [Aldrovandia affinis]
MDACLMEAGCSWGRAGVWEGGVLLSEPRGGRRPSVWLTAGQLSGAEFLRRLPRAALHGHASRRESAARCARVAEGRGAVVGRDILLDGTHCCPVILLVNHPANENKCSYIYRPTLRFLRAEHAAHMAHSENARMPLFPILLPNICFLTLPA